MQTATGKVNQTPLVRPGSNGFLCRDTGLARPQPINSGHWEASLGRTMYQVVRSGLRDSERDRVSLRPLGPYLKLLLSALRSLPQGWATVWPSSLCGSLLYLRGETMDLCALVGEQNLDLSYRFPSKMMEIIMARMLCRKKICDRGKTIIF